MYKIMIFSITLAIEAAEMVSELRCAKNCAC